jgi:hypothetical protein
MQHQWTGSNLDETRAWLAHRYVCANLDGSITFERRTGRERAQAGEWMIKTGDVHVWQPHTFSRRVSRNGMAT